MPDQDNHLEIMRHSLAHILATAISHLWPETKFGIGPTIENGFYYDIDLGDKSLSEEDLSVIQAEMQKVIARDEKFIKSDVPIDEAIKWAKVNHQIYKEELLNDLKRAGTTAYKDLKPEEIGTIGNNQSDLKIASFYKNGDFTDLCQGPHIESTGKAGVFKLTKLSGAYWRGDESKPQLQRVYGVAFDNQKNLDDYLKRQAEAKERDHRRLGSELDLFVMSDLVGAGLPIFTPRGEVIRRELIKFSEELQVGGGYQAVWAPHMTRAELYKQSGHYDKYPERFMVKSTESKDEFMLKPMNCPHVVQIYASRPRSYRELPLRLMETTTMYRDEKSGEIHGLFRVRSLTQDDSHAFVTDQQIESEIKSIIGMVKQMYLTLDMPLDVVLSFRDETDKYFGDKEKWHSAQTSLVKIAKAEDLKYQIILGEAAFYGPKIDIFVSDALGRRWQCATVQLDYVMPERFKLEYTAEDGQLKRPAMIHKAILGSIERFMAVYIEHTAGKFPVWLAPEQIRLLSVNQADSTLKLAQAIKEKATKLDLRLEIDGSNTSISKKIRLAETLKVPYAVVIGNKEIASGQLLPRIRSDLVVQPRDQSLATDEFLKTVANEVHSRVNRTSL